MTRSIRANWVCRGASAAPAADPASDSGGETIRDRDLGSEAAQISVPGRLSDQDLIRADITSRTSICHSSITVKHLHLIQQTERSRRGGEIHTDKYCGLYKPRLRRCSSSLQWPASALDDGLHSLTWGQMLSSRSGVMIVRLSVLSLTVVTCCRSASLLQHCSTRQRALASQSSQTQAAAASAHCSQSCAEAGLSADAAAAASCHPAVTALQSQLLHADTQTPPLAITQPQVTPEREHHNTITVDTVTMEQSLYSINEPE